jgi:hypothetical protein
MTQSGTSEGSKSRGNLCYASAINRERRSAGGEDEEVPMTQRKLIVAIAFAALPSLAQAAEIRPTPAMLARARETQPFAELDLDNIKAHLFDQAVPASR